LGLSIERARRIILAAIFIAIVTPAFGLLLVDVFSGLDDSEKFGGLHFYIRGGNERISQRIATAEGRSYRICEVCGQPGRDPELDILYMANSRDFQVSIGVGQRLNKRVVIGHTPQPEPCLVQNTLMMIDIGAKWKYSLRSSYG